MNWISINKDFPSGAIVIASAYGTRSYMGYSERVALKRYREAFGLERKKLTRI